ncbi:MAG: mechanosensitive ion channel family protein [Gammaproteobacteria bacterium]|nr:mechanosensitive ion channel family protein [Gammaproteobacteria bacterium]
MDYVLDGFVAQIRDYFSAARIGGFLANSLINVLLIIIVFVLFYVLWRLLQNLLMPKFRAKVDKTSAALLDAIFRSFFIGAGILVALSVAGVQTTTMLASLGVLSLTIGFALRDTLSNIISGFLIFLDRPFTIDDLVEIDGKYGRVDRITLRTTRIVTIDGRMLAVPNAEVMNKTVASYTNFPHLRLDVAVTIDVNENLDRVRAVLLQLVNHDTDYMTEPKPRMVVTQLNDYNVALELQVWLENERQHIHKRYELREKIFKTFMQEGINMPFETIELVSPSIVNILNKSK